MVLMPTIFYGCSHRISSMVWPFDSLASSSDLEQLEDSIKNIRSDVDGHEQDLDQLLELIEEVKELAQDNEEDIENLEEETKRMDQVLEEVREEALEDQEISLQPMEQEIFKVLMKAESSLKYKEIGSRMEKERTADQVRPKLISLKEKVSILEDKDGRAKVFYIPSKVKTDYLEKGELAEIEQF